jgi:iron complex outermembrane receptor protein
VELRIVRTIKIIAALVLIFSAGESLAQGSGTLRGTVIEKKSGLPVIGATVYLEEIKKGAATDIDGNYSVKVSPQTKLVYSFIGYQSQTIAVGQQPIINVALQTEVKGLDEVVVIGYGTVKKSDATGSD